VRVVIIINPISGTGRRPDVARRRAELAAAVTSARGIAAEIVVTERPGHARELATAALARGVAVVVAWGGDGTVNEVASALAFRDATLAVVPSGSGNGLARELRIPLDAAAALTVALTGRSRTIDCGELDGRLFVNVAGLGLDARIAHQFAARGLLRRGFPRYLAIGARELLRFDADDQAILADGVTQHARALIIALANGRQYGNGALIAPEARIDDGKLDLVVVADRPIWRALLDVPHLFSGGMGRVPGVTMTQASRVEITSSRQVLYHVDGEPCVGGAVLHGQVHPRALRVRVPEP
jgi:YegS/Rv2252/BmrU family lipid kinase